jgi:glycosyltransferase involved in cell wall biosynthesis
VEGLVAKQLPGVVAYPAGNRLGGEVSPEEISRRSMQPMPLQILFLGNVIPRKGLQVLLSALKMVTDTPWLLTVVGSLEMDPLYAHEMQEQVRRDGLEAQVKFLGPLVESQLADCMNRQHLLIVPSFYEGFGIAYLEGMDFGLPAIASTAGAAHEIITDGRDGFLIPPGDTSLLARHIGSLGANRSRLAEMGLAARERFLAHPTWEESAGTVRTFLERLVTPGAALTGL